MTEEPVLVDTSGLYAVLDASDPNHAWAAAAMTTLLDDQTPLRTHSYVLVEAAALVQSRLGMRAAAVLQDHWVQLLDVRWVDAALHQRAVSALLAAERRSVSLVDWVSFEMMREEHLRRALSTDGHFAERGYELIGRD